MTDTGNASIYDTIGGEEALTAVVGDFYGRVLADPELAGFFAGTDMSRLTAKQVQFLAGVLGGPDFYTGPSMRDVHQGRGIGQKHFDRVAGHLVAALGAADVPAPVIEQIASLVVPLAADIVSGSGPHKATE
jgi:hemoglobin